MLPLCESGRLFTGLGERETYSGELSLTPSLPHFLALIKSPRSPLYSPPYHPPNAPDNHTLSTPTSTPHVDLRSIAIDIRHLVAEVTPE
jgi:hypothetical protein